MVGGGSAPARPLSARPVPAREPRDPRPAARSADLARSPVPRPPPCFRSPGSASCARCGSCGGREVMLGADYHEKGCAWKSLLHATVNLTKGVGVTERGPGGVTRKLGVSWMRRRPEEVAFASSWKAVAFKERGRDASSFARELKTQKSFLLSLPPSLLLSFSALPALYPDFLEILSQSHSYILFSFYLISPFCNLLFCFLTSLLPRSDFLTPLCVQIYHFVLKTQC